MAAWVIVDDTDDAINYTGPWSIGTLTANEATNSDIGFDLDAHVITPAAFNTTEPTASLFYTFNGTRVGVFGLDATFNSSTQSPGIILPLWECFVDNNSISNNQPFGAYPLQSYCETDDLMDGLHTLEFRVTRAGLGLWFDYLRYMPSSSDKVPTSSVAWYAATDIQLLTQTQGGWVSIGDGFLTENVTLTEPIFFMNYFGGSFRWYGLSKAAIELASPESFSALSMSLPTAIKPGYYSIDNGPLNPFPVDQSQQPVASEFNPYTNIIFATNSAPPAQHNITVFYDRENNTVWPLTLEYITIDGAFDGSQSVSSSTSTASANSSTGKAAVIGGAVGGVLGGILLVALGLFVLRRWRMHKRRLQRESIVENLARSDIKLRPFTKIVYPGLEKAQRQAQPA